MTHPSSTVCPATQACRIHQQGWMGRTPNDAPISSPNRARGIGHWPRLIQDPFLEHVLLCGYPQQEEVNLIVLGDSLHPIASVISSMTEKSGRYVLLSQMSCPSLSRICSVGVTGLLKATVSGTSLTSPEVASQAEEPSSGNRTGQGL